MARRGTIARTDPIKLEYVEPTSVLYNFRHIIRFWGAFNRQLNLIWSLAFCGLVWLFFLHYLDISHWCSALRTQSGVEIINYRAGIKYSTVGRTNGSRPI